MLRLHSRLLTLAFSSSLLAASAWAAPTLTVGNPSGQAGTVVDLPITFDHGTSSVGFLQFDLILPPALSEVSFTTGTIVTSAGKGVATAQINSTTWRFFIAAVNVNTISNGTLLTLQLMIAGGTAPSTLSVSVPSNSVEYGDPSGTIIPPGPTTNGTVTVTGGPQVALTKTVDKSTALSGSVLTYTISYTNGGAASASNFKISDAVPAGTTVTGTISNGGVLNAGTITWLLGSIPAAPAVGSSGSVSFQAQVQ